MIAMTDEDQRIAFFGKLHRFYVDLCDKWTSRIYHTQTAFFAGVADFGRDAVGAVNYALAFGDFVN